MSTIKTNNNDFAPLIDLFYVYNPRFHLLDLISTRRSPFSSNHGPPRPPNSFFLMKNCYMLELRMAGFRIAMPDLCRKAKLIWRDIPQAVKDRYDHLALEAQILHQTMYPNYTFKPKKRAKFKHYSPSSPQELNNSMNAFPANGFLNNTGGNTSPSLESSGSETSAAPTPMIRSPNIYLPDINQADFLINNINSSLSSLEKTDYNINLYNEFGCNSDSILGGSHENGNAFNNVHFDHYYFNNYNQFYNNGQPYQQ
ncbi:hypothetical protein C1645_808180 [Glomus cerebriforme]|uniref:HMG box domain-containing protein n=1 Tax=Glomus cerebriforme TaxID=658196 RepID=A0A397SLY0_9GLOM|nr:hypothetical protein C1645_808180 [Glomus cerebriforme]